MAGLQRSYLSELEAGKETEQVKRILRVLRQLGVRMALDRRTGSGEELAAWLYGDRVAIIEHARGRPRLVYTAKALDRYALGTPLLSHRRPS